MMWKINLSKQTDKFIKKKKIKDDEILLFVNKFINYSKGSDENINVKSMKGKWNRMDYRGNVYK